jgi:peptidoglycan hydrolase-like protein with peptidoglycan-binding domain
MKQVQTAMVVFGYFEGPIDGKFGPGTREALIRLRTDYGLKATGTITPKTLDALRIQAR